MPGNRVFLDSNVVVYSLLDNAVVLNKTNIAKRYDQIIEGKLKIINPFIDLK